MTQPFGLRRTRAYSQSMLCALFLVIGLLALGAALATTNAPLVAGATVALIALAITSAVFLRDPVKVMIGFWVFQVCLAPFSALFGYTSHAGHLVRQGNDLLIVLFIGLAVLRLRVTSPKCSGLLWLAVPGALVAIVGLASSFLHDAPISVTASGLWLGLKLWILLALSALLPWKGSDYERIYMTLTRTGVLIACIGLIDYITNGGIASLLHTNVSHPSEFRASAVQSTFANPGEYSLCMSLLVAMTAARYMVRRHRADLYMWMLFATSVILSLRFKGALALGAIMLVIGLCRRGDRRSTARAVVLATALLAVVLATFEGSVITHQVSTYSSLQSNARGRLYKVSYEIAGAEFPLGAGFGRYASYPSALHYSPVYDEYGLSETFGLTAQRPDFIEDTSWPSVLGESGVFGLACYLLGIVAIVVALYRRSRRCLEPVALTTLTALCVTAVIVADSLGAPTLFDWLATTTLALVAGAALSDTSDLLAGSTPRVTAKPRGRRYVRNS